jgi:hypothetical protein
MAKPTNRYASIMAALPIVFVGSEHYLQQLVKLICREMHNAFTVQGVSIPPWRSKESLLSKWKVPKASSWTAPADVRFSQAVLHRQRSTLLMHGKPHGPSTHKNTAGGGCQAVTAMSQTSSVCRAGSHGASSSMSDGGSADHPVAPFHALAGLG